MKTCTNCNLEKELSEFYKASRLATGYMSQCKDCHKVMNKAHYSSNKTDYVDRSLAQRDNVLELVRFVKEVSGCVRCGESNWWRLAFHHIDPSQKDIDVAKIKSVPQAVSEMEKCIVVCHNCHADIHHEERLGT